MSLEKNWLTEAVRLKLEAVRLKLEAGTCLAARAILRLRLPASLSWKELPELERVPLMGQVEYQKLQSETEEIEGSS